ncbi:MSMEG_0567/sll0787 family protein [Nakamurella deserti]|uniref:MSMEG_0567/sll0787 family protein n=1 Tax=Nakamurella deserti TaxID=2164074 RepID=UPI001F0C6BAE|nr:MSMEG_0567/sll0787 family protein [Nakamurella deserti]
MRSEITTPAPPTTPTAGPLDVSVLTGGPRTATAAAPFLLSRAETAADLAAYHRLRRAAFVERQQLFTGSDRDDVDDDPRTVVIVARAGGHIVGGVRLAPAGRGPDIGWWAGSRLVVSRDGQALRGVGAALIRAACAAAESAGVLRFDAMVQGRNETLFRRLGWDTIRTLDRHGLPHVEMRYPIDRIARLASATKAALASVLEPFRDGVTGLGGGGFVGDDGAPVPGTDVIAACDAILPTMVERSPEWAGWCAVLVNVNDLSAMGAAPVGLLDAIGARDASFARRIVSGLRDASRAWGVPVLGGHTQFGVPASLSVTALGRTDRPVPAGGGRVGHRVTVTADLGGGWRPGYTGAQWDSTSTRSAAELRTMASFVARTAPAAAKDVSMAGAVGTLGMLAESSGTGAVLDVAAVPRPAGATAGDWLTCFPGFAMLTTDAADRPVAPAGPATSAVCGELTAAPGVRLRWPDGETTDAVTTLTGLGPA